MSVVRGDEGPREGMCNIDDYVRTVEPVYDYLTRFSGLVHGDLDPGSKVCVWPTSFSAPVCFPGASVT